MAATGSADAIRSGSQTRATRERIDLRPAAAEPCGPGGCPAWVVEDLIETIGGFDFEYSPVGLIDAIGMGGAQPPAIGGWMPIGF